MPTDGKEIVDLFQFLNSGRYNSSITNATRITNSHRAADA